MAARTRKTVLSDIWKERIQAGVIMDRVLKHLNGEIELSNTQMQAAKLLLSKIVPDLARTEMTGADGKELIPSTININPVRAGA